MIGRIFTRPHAAALLAVLIVGSSTLPAPAAPVSSVPAAPPPALSYADTASAPAKPAPAKPAGPAPADRPRRHHQAGRPSAAPARSVFRDAEVRSTEVPRAPEFVNAALHYTYEPGKLYTVQTAVGYLTAIALRPGEHLLSKAAGDTVKWEVGETSQGSAAGAQVLLLIKPLDPGVRTNMILTTDQRTYVLDLVSADGSDHATFVDWRYPADEMRDLQIQRAALTVQALAAQGASRLAASPFIAPAGSLAPAGAPRIAGPAGSFRPIASADLAPAALNFNYKVEPRSRPAPGWTPEHVFDDGKKTYVKFPANIATQEIPPLFVIGPKGEAELVNYRFENGYYIVDRLFSTAELRIGTRDPQVVRISYKGGAR